MMFVAFGHSLLAMSGFETLAQVYREIAYPKLKNLRITAKSSASTRLFSTGLVSLFAVMIIPDNVRPQYYDNLIGGLSMNLVGPDLLQADLPHVRGDRRRADSVRRGQHLDHRRERRPEPRCRRRRSARVVPQAAQALRHHLPHHQPDRVAQVLTIIGSRGDVYLLGEAYAFGVVWSFFMKGLGVLALRFQRHDQEYKTPFNFRIGKTEIPVGLGVTVTGAVFRAIANLFTKKIATIYGVSFTVVLFVVFIISERVNRRRMQDEKTGLENFNLDHQPQIVAEHIRARPGSVLVAVRGNTLEHLAARLRENKPAPARHRRDDGTPLSTGAGEFELNEDQIFSDYEQELSASVVELAEKEGKHVELLVVPAVDPFDAMVQTATQSESVEAGDRRLGADGVGRTRAAYRSRMGAIARTAAPLFARNHQPRPAVDVRQPRTSPAALWPEDIDRLHEIWLRLSAQENLGSKLHHRDVIGLALRRLPATWNGGKREEIVGSLEREIRDHKDSADRAPRQTRARRIHG